jgi:hypothetical protein
MPLPNPENVSVAESKKSEAMMGLDEEDLAREAEIKILAEAIRTEREMLKSDVKKEIEFTVDMAYYYLSNDAFYAVLPVLEVNFFLTI